MNRAFLFFFCLFFLIGIELFSQKSSIQETAVSKGRVFTPLEPVLELPSAFLESEDLLEEAVDSLLPALPLLSPRENILLLPESKSPELEKLEQEEKEESNYFKFMGGIGSLASLMGDFSWYYFSSKGLSSHLRVAHQNSHFWNYLPKDQQGQDRKEEIEWNFSYQEKKYQVSLELDYLEQQSWLQNRVELFDSSVWRRIYFKNDYQYQINSALSSYGEWVLEDWIQTENYAENAQSSLLFDPKIGIRFQQENYSFDFHFDYHLDYTDSFKTVNHFCGAFADFQINLPYRFKLGANLGISYDSNEWSIAYSKNYLAGVQIPFALQFAGTPFDWFSFEIKGGYERYREPLIHRFQEVLAFMNYVDFFNQEAWFFQSTFQFFIQQQVEVFSGIDYRKKGHGFILSEPSGNLSLLPPSKKHATGLVNLSLYPVETLYFHLGLKSHYRDLIDFFFRYQGELLSPYSLLEPEHRLSLSLDYCIPQKWFGGSFLFQFDVFEEARIPEISLGFFFEVEKGYRLWLKGEDLLSPIYGKAGRPARWNFMEKGIQFALLVEISV